MERKYLIIAYNEDKKNMGFLVKIIDKSNFKQDIFKLYSRFLTRNLTMS